MIFLSAQPDDYYFTWQLELQLYNFHQLGIPPANIHVLIAYHPRRGLRKHFRDMISRNRYATFFAYPDERESKQYIPSIRPHIIKQHLAAYPALQQTDIFYHDSDILLRELIEFILLAEKDTWFVSNTASYLDVNYIRHCGGEEMLDCMCEVTGINKETVIANNDQVGGAQYYLKSTDYAFWDKVERDCEALFTTQMALNRQQGEKEYLASGLKRTQYAGIQAWCADMWAILWNAWLRNTKVKTHPELDFCWTKEPIAKWDQCKILHYSGVLMQKGYTAFQKQNYTQFPPFYDDFSDIDQTSCSAPVVSLMRDYIARPDRERINMKDLTILIPVRIDTKHRLENLLTVVRYLDRCLDTNILIAESDASSQLVSCELPDSCQLFFLQDDNPAMHHTRINNFLVEQAVTDIIMIYDTDVIFPVEQLVASVERIRSRQADYVSPYDGSFYNVEKSVRNMFMRFLDTALIKANMNKISSVSRRSWGGACMIRKEAFIKAGMDNEFFKSWGPEDIERVARMRTLGFSVQRVDGLLFHLDHERKANSGYTSKQERLEYMTEYFKICNMRRRALKDYINTWAWMPQKAQL